MLSQQASSSAASSSKSFSLDQLPNHLSDAQNKRNQALSEVLSIVRGKSATEFRDKFHIFRESQEKLISILEKSIAENASKANWPEVAKYFWLLSQAVSGHFYKNKLEKFTREYKDKFQSADELVQLDNEEEDALFIIGFMYGEGIGIPKSTTKAEAYYEYVSNRGGELSAHAAIRLGLLFESQEHRFKNGTIQKLLLQAANQKDLDGQYHLARIAEKYPGYFSHDYGKAEAEHFTYKEPASLGYADALYQVGLNYLYGPTKTRSHASVARRCFRLAATQGNPEASFELGKIIHSGKGIKKDITLALKGFEEASEGGVARATAFLGHMYELGDGVEIDLEKAIHYYQKAVKQGAVIANFYLGRVYEIQSEFPKAVKHYRLAEKDKVSRAYYRLGLACEGVQPLAGITVDNKKALSRYQSASKLNHTDSKYHFYLLFKKLQDGVSYCDDDYNYSEHVLLEAAEKGHMDAQYELGMRYLDKSSYGEQKHKYKLVFDYLFAAAEQGHVDAQYQLGLLYKDGKAVEKDLNKAIQYLSTAASQQHSNAHYQLGKIYLKGLSGVIDYDCAYGCFKAAGEDHLMARHQLGDMHRLGLGVKTDFREAAEHYEAAGDENPMALYQLGEMYRLGLGVDIDCKIAAEYYDKALEVPNKVDIEAKKLASYRLARFYEKGLGVEKDIVSALECYQAAVNSPNVGLKSLVAVTRLSLSGAFFSSRPGAENLQPLKNQLAAESRELMEDPTQPSTSPARFPGRG